MTDGTRTMEIYRMQGFSHVDTMLFAYLPKEKILIELTRTIPRRQTHRPHRRSAHFCSVCTTISSGLIWTLM